MVYLWVPGDGGPLATLKYITLKSLNTGTPKTINFPFVPNGKLMIFKCPSIEHIRL